MRRRSNREIGEYDSLTDTVTNVVGVLVIVLAVTRVSLGSGPVPGAPPSVSSEALADATAAHARICAALADLRQRWGLLDAQATDKHIERDRLVSTIQELEAEVARPLESTTNPEELARKIAELQSSIDDMKKAEHEKHQRLQEAQAKLDSKDYGFPAQQVLTVPYPDPAKAKNKQSVEFCCHLSRVHPLEREKLSKLLSQQTKEIPGFGNLSPYEQCLRLEKRCRETDVADEYLRWRIKITDLGTKFSARAELQQRNPSVGESAEGLASKDSEFRKFLGTLDPDKQWVYFHAWEDSFDAYLAADRIAREKGFATGWIAVGDEESLGVSLTGSSTSSAGRDPIPQ